MEVFIFFILLLVLIIIIHIYRRTYIIRDTINESINAVPISQSLNASISSKLSSIVLPITSVDSSIGLVGVFNLFTLSNPVYNFTLNNAYYNGTECIYSTSGSFSSSYSTEVIYGNNTNYAVNINGTVNGDINITYNLNSGVLTYNISNLNNFTIDTNDSISLCKTILGSQYQTNCGQNISCETLIDNLCNGTYSNFILLDVQKISYNVTNSTTLTTPFYFRSGLNTVLCSNLSKIVYASTSQPVSLNNTQDDFSFGSYEDAANLGNKGSLNNCPYITYDGNTTLNNDNVCNFIINCLSQ